jgi:hypothetical protein
VATGSNGLEELVGKLDDGGIQFGAFRAAAIERKGQKLRWVIMGMGYYILWWKDCVKD